MQTALDKLGRVVIPKLVRLHLGLKAGTLLKIEERERQVILEPIDKETCLVEKDGLLVFSGSASEDLSGRVRSHRIDRLEKLGFDRE